MKCTIKNKQKEKSGIELGDIPKGYWVGRPATALPSEKYLIFSDSDVVLILNLTTGGMCAFDLDTFFFNLIPVKITEINIEEI